MGRERPAVADHKELVEGARAGEEGLVAGVEAKALELVELDTMLLEPEEAVEAVVDGTPALEDAEVG